MCMVWSSHVSVQTTAPPVCPEASSAASAFASPPLAAMSSPTRGLPASVAGLWPSLLADTSKLFEAMAPSPVAFQGLSLNGSRRDTASLFQAGHTISSRKAITFTAAPNPCRRADVAFGAKWEMKSLVKDVSAKTKDSSPCI